MEIKHGRAAMLGFLHVIALKAGIVLPGDLSPSLGVSFSDVPTTCFGSLEAVPTFGWLQIMLFTCMQETGASMRSTRPAALAAPRPRPSSRLPSHSAPPVKGQSAPHRQRLPLLCGLAPSVREP